ncbi:RNA-binding protein spenito-like [Haliotis cracherodii]|uniref:RNA-binding protein spenito-like n=1 Tax=Haliotis cracherodii TaxID=6455 RepID=UPI0039ED035B
MKRQQDRDASPRSKRSRSSYSLPDHDSIRDRLSPEFDRRERGGKFNKSYPPRRDDFDRGEMDHPRKHFRNDRMMDQGGYAQSRDQSKSHDYRSLCISSIPSKIPDPLLRDTLLQEFKKYGEMNVKITVSGDQRVAYVNFRYPEHARVAKHAKAKLVLFDRQVRVDPVFNKRTRSNSPNSEYNNRDMFYGHASRMGSGGSPPPPHMMGNRRGGGRGGGGDRPIQPAREFVPRGDAAAFAAAAAVAAAAGQPLDRPRAPNEKFPHHLDHVDPEFDDKATRTLFVGNLDVNITDGELRRIFEKYGSVEDIDIKRPQRGQGNAYAFIKFINLDCAHKSKVDMSGKYIGKFQCKIGYGKVTPTTCLWVGGLGPWVSYDTLEREFDRFGAIHRIEWPHGKNYAYVLYDGVDAATAACQDMRGWPMGGHNRRLRVDFADPNTIAANVSEQDSPYQEQGRGFEVGEKGGPWKGQGSDGQGDRRSRRDDWHIAGGDPMNAYRNPDNPRDSERRRDDWDRLSDHSDRLRRPRSPGELGIHRSGRSRSPDRPREFIGRDGIKDHDALRRTSGESGKECDERIGRNGRRLEGDKELNISDHVGSLSDLAKCLPVAWNGALILKSSSFAARMHVVSGDVTIVDNLMRDPTTTESPVLKITQRLRLDQPKLDDVGRRIQSSGAHGHCILLALPSTVQSYEDPSGSIQPRPLKNLVTYLKQKEAAGVISLPPNPSQDKNNVGVLHAFPPCSFGYSFLQKRAPQLPADPAKEDYLVVVVVLGAA